LNCPKCQSPMEKVAFHEFSVDRCTGCKGIWFTGTTHKELNKIHGSESIDTGSEKVGREFDGMRNVPCPECSLPMDRIADLFHPHLHYDACPLHEGFFFDAGEFKEYKDEGLMDFIKSLSWLSKRRK
jgi:uncharacterized protein